MKPNVWIFCLEPIDSRYTKQWYENIPRILQRSLGDRFNVRQIDGVQRKSNVTNGAFLNFSDTNYWKSSQLCEFLNCFDNNETTSDDHFLFTDAWNPVILQINYMKNLLDQKWKIHGIWHAGAYDPSDILGYKMEKPWPWFTETALFHSCDYNYYATEFHKTMFLNNLKIESQYHNRAIRSGQPHNHFIDLCWPKDKENILMWPHRYNSDKQPEIIEDLKQDIQAETIITQKLSLNKLEYYNILGKAKAMFSCSLHENLGISLIEGVLAEVIPVVPDRCSYKEIYLPEFIYPSSWTENFDNYLKNKDKLMDFINEKIVNYEHYKDALRKQKEIIIKEYITPTIMINKFLE